MFEIAPSYPEVSAELLIAYAIESAALPPLGISLFIEAFENVELRPEASRIRSELRVEIGRSAPSPWTDLLTDIATGDHRPDSAPQFVWN